MADQERKDDAVEKDQDAAEEEAQEASSKAQTKVKTEPDEASDDADDDAGEERSAADDGDGDSDGDAAKRVAKALGVEDEAGEGGEAAKTAEAKEPEVAPNRALRRRDEAMERRKKRKGGATAKADKPEGDDEALPRDKNARAKELLKRRREQAAGPRPIQLLPGEMVDDALARSGSAASKWIRENFGMLQWVIVAAVVGAGVFALYSSQNEKKAAAATNQLFTGVSAELGRVMAEDKRPDEEKEADPTKIFKTPEERTEAALAGYRKTIAEHPGTIIAQLAKLGEAGALLDKHDWPAAIEAYSAALASKLTSTDLDVKGRATEGLGFAKEGKGDLDGALATFKELEGIDAPGYKELGLYQQGRILLAKGDTDKAKEVLTQAREKLQTPGSGKASFEYLKAEVDETLRRIDPNLVPTQPSFGQPSLGSPNGNSMTQEQIQKLLQDAAKKKPQQQEEP